ncbi:hypothetical protein PUNSTDRAFT_134877 [Punctularia strigosozonata HHB-11173 SS5]|uniref:uncharacterized protein n=1 Tax=Punctularia strigosozonata (strain HHB-11173) TaxID=741275 RepID=UPI00044165CC|nr:uncharacterized protein PUNSTDRAFT_134877 [Punctularia strigosozonata HHB-11173 SS5]EIN08498.1 hypothetical protein PUNSTDRAFT_134877 [Punctularia strigosozonata HHB-11173 SS5]
MINWQESATVEIQGYSEGMNIADWLVRSEDSRSRTMEVGNMRYRWMPIGDHLCLTMHLTPTADSSSTLCILCRVTKSRTEITLELSREAMVIGLEIPAVVATVILMSGKNID